MKFGPISSVVFMDIELSEVDAWKTSMYMPMRRAKSTNRNLRTGDIIFCDADRGPYTFLGVPSFF